LFAGFLSTDVVNHLVLKRDKRVRDDLFVGGIDLSFWSRKKKIVSTQEERVEIFLRLKVEAVKRPKFVEQAAPDDEHVFYRRIHRRNLSNLRRCHSDPAVAGEESLIICSQTGERITRDVSTSLDMTDGTKTST
jgi:hypothetical protein